VIVALSPNGQNINSGEEPPARLLVATLKGINILDRELPRGPWTNRGRKLEGQHPSSIMVEPKRGGIFAGMHSGGLYYSGDNGETWELRNNGLTIDHVFCLAYAHHGDRVVLYAGTEPASIFRSDDYGQTWTEQPDIIRADGKDKWVFPSPPHLAHTKTITVDPHNPDVIYAGVEQGAEFKTTDGGATWREISHFSKPSDWTYRDVHLLTVHPDASNELYLTTGMGLYRSYDGGESESSWQLITNNDFRIGYPDHFIISPRDGNTMFMAGSAKNPGEWQKSKRAEMTIMKTTDRAKTWFDASDGLPDDRRPNIEGMCVASYPGGFTLFAGDTDGVVYASDDEAAHWAQIANGLAPVTKGRHFRMLQPA